MTQIPIPQDFMGPRHLRSRGNSEIVLSRANSLARTPKSLIDNLKNDPFEIKDFSNPKEIASEQISDRILDYLSYEITHGDNLFRDLINKFADLYNIRYQKYLPEELKVRTAPSTPVMRSASQSGINFAGAYDIKQKKFSEQAVSVGMDVFKSCEMPRVISKATVNRAINDVKEFIQLLEILLYQVVYQFVLQEGGSIGMNFDRKLKQTVHIGVLHPSVPIYNTLFKIIEQHFDQKQRNLELQMEKWKTLRPEDFNIEETFCLPDEELPYLGAIEALNMLNVVFTPTEKLKIVKHLKNEIVRAVDNYWLLKDPTKKVSELTISADQLIPIYTYIVAKSGNKRIKANLMFIETLLDDQFVKFGEEAYFFATLTISMDYVIGLAEGRREPEKVIEEKKADSSKDDDLAIRRCNTADTITRSSLTPTLCNSSKKTCSMMLIEEVDEISRYSEHGEMH